MTEVMILPRSCRLFLIKALAMVIIFCGISGIKRKISNGGIFYRNHVTIFKESSVIVSGSAGTVTSGTVFREQPLTVTARIKTIDASLYKEDLFIIFSSCDFV